MDNSESNQVVDAIIQKVKSDLENAEKHERNTLVDAIASKVKKDLETNNKEKSEEAADADKPDNQETTSPSKEKTAANSTDGKDKEEMADGLSN